MGELKNSTKVKKKNKKVIGTLNKYYNNAEQKRKLLICLQKMYEDVVRQ